MIVDIIIWLLFGGLAGYLVALITGSRGDIVTNSVIGVIGSLLSILMMNSSNTLNALNAIGFNFSDLSVAIIGAAVFALVFQVFKLSNLNS